MNNVTDDSIGVPAATRAVQGRGCCLLTVHEQTPLAEAALLAPGDIDSLFLITDTAKRVVGAIASAEIFDRLDSGPRPERERWADMPVGALLPMYLPAAFDGIGILAEPPLCGRGMEDTVPSALLCYDDVYVSWRRLSPALRSAFCDPLTSLPNRAGMELRLRQDWNRATQSGTTMTLMVIDLDHFKQVNDTYGHVYGDGVLRRVASALKNSLRSYDLVARYGGDEFVAVCVDCDPDEVSLPVRRMLESVQSIRIADDGSRNASISIGAVTCRPGIDMDSPMDLVFAADECLYEAKRNCRGSAFHAEPGISPHRIVTGAVADVSVTGHD